MKAEVKENHSLAFILAAFILIVHRYGFSGHTILLVSPAAKVYQLTAFGAERTVRVILPFGGFTAGRTLHNEKFNDKKNAIEAAR
jgi:hypothetical protein